MAGGYDDWLSILGLGAVFAFGYYLHTRGTFNEIFASINKALDEIKKVEPDKKEEEEKEKKDSKLAYSFPAWSASASGTHRAYKSFVVS